MQEGIRAFASEIMGSEKFDVYLDRLNAVTSIREATFHVEEVTGEDKDIDVVVDIFNRVNSEGTKLSKGDLALAKVCAEWPDARATMRNALTRWTKADYHFQLDWLLRCANTVATGRAKFSALHDVDATQFRQALSQAEKAIDYLLNAVAGRLGLDHDQVLFGVYGFPVMAHYVVRRGGKLTDARERDKLLYWYAQSAMWGRFSGSTESQLDKDLALLEKLDGGLDRLIETLRLWRGGLTVEPAHFDTATRGSRFYPTLYLLTRLGEALDWSTGLPLKQQLLGHRSRLHVHHIFPKALLKRDGRSHALINAVANFALLTADANLEISATDPTIYLPEIESRFPGALESHWIPMDRELWRIERYEDFLAERRRLLAGAANDLLGGLLGDETIEPAALPRATARPIVEVYQVPGGIASDEEEQLLNALNDWVSEQGLPRGEILYELAHEESGQPLAVLDLAWPDGLQSGLTEPVAVLIDEGKETLNAANAARFRYFTNIGAFKQHVRQDVLGIDDTILTQPATMFEAYEVLEELGGGGMAHAYKVRLRGSEEPLFLKRVRLDGSHDERALLREQQIYARLQRLENPHVLRIYGFERSEEWMALVTEYAAGGNLADHIAARPGGHLGAGEAKRIASQILAALAALHEADVIHRDLKPDNIVSVDGVWKLADFGIAKNLNRLMTQFTFQQSGTIGYAAPEQMDGAEARPSADVYSFGKLVSFLLTGQTDVDRVTYPSWAQLVRACTRRDPDARPVLQEIARMLENVPT